jgi:hypothetical protein
MSGLTSGSAMRTRVLKRRHRAECPDWKSRRTVLLIAGLAGSFEFLTCNHWAYYFGGVWSAWLMPVPCPHQLSFGLTPVFERSIKFCRSARNLSVAHRGIRAIPCLLSLRRCRNKKTVDICLVPRIFAR